MQLTLTGTDEAFNISNITCTERQANTGTYHLSGVSTELISLAQKNLKNKIYFDCSIQVGNKVLLKGEDCWFQFPDYMKNGFILIVGWVEKENL